MATLISIPGIGKTSLELLEAAGFHDSEALVNVGVAELTRELERANSILKICKRTPTQAAVGNWIEGARKLLGEPPPAAAPAGVPVVNNEPNAEVMALLANAPFAIPLPVRALVDAHLGVGDIPAAILLNHSSPGELDFKLDHHRLPAQRHAKPATTIGPGYVRLADTSGSRLEIDTSRMRSTDNLATPLPRTAPGAGTAAVTSAAVEDRLTLLRTPRSTTNKGRNPQSRWYIRGVLHSHPWSIYLGAVATLLLMVMVPAAVISAALLLASRELPERFSWVPDWLLVFPAVLPLFGLAYLIVGLGNCRICGQKLFVHRSHLKNSRSHRIRGFGYILPLCIHIVLFRWFRCTHCGTPVRLKK